MFPSYDKTVHADAIVVLGPVDPWRVDLAKTLVDEGLADTVAMSSFTPDFSESYCHWGRATVNTICYTPDPSTTQGEARWVKEQAAAKGWKTVIVITVSAHVERARFIFTRCLDHNVRVAVTGRPPPGADLPFYIHHLWYQSGGFVKAIFVTPGC